MFHRGLLVVYVSLSLTDYASYVHLNLLILVRQIETPVSSMKVAVHRRSLRLPYSLRATGVWSGQIPFLSGS